MTKKQNTLIFMLCATLVNLLLIFGITALLLFICIHLELQKVKAFVELFLGNYYKSIQNEWA